MTAEPFPRQDPDESFLILVKATDLVAHKTVIDVVGSHQCMLGTYHSIDDEKRYDKSVFNSHFTEKETSYMGEDMH